MGYTLQRGRRYKTTVSLGLGERLASNDLIAEKFRAAGFSDVTITGTSGTRYVEGVWSADEITPPMPPQVTDISEVA